MKFTNIIVFFNICSSYLFFYINIIYIYIYIYIDIDIYIYVFNPTYSHFIKHVET